jgi:hypothetical protein
VFIQSKISSFFTFVEARIHSHLLHIFIPSRRPGLSKERPNPRFVITLNCDCRLPSSFVFRGVPQPILLHLQIETFHQRHHGKIYSYVAVGRFCTSGQWRIRYPSCYRDQGMSTIPQSMHRPFINGYTRAPSSSTVTMAPNFISRA